MPLFDYDLDPSSLPWLYRVQVPGIATKLVDGALISSGMHYTDHIITKCASRMLHEHFLWTSNHLSPFISVFTSEDHARNWAQTRPQERWLHLQDLPHQFAAAREQRNFRC